MTAQYNTAGGINALDRLTSGQNDTAWGQAALSWLTSGSGDAGFGVDAGQLLQTGNNNTAVGNYAMNNPASGDNNTAVGFQALSYSTGSNNIAIGYFAGSNLSGTGSSNIDIGNLGVSTDSQTIRIGNSQVQTYIAGQLNANAGGLTAIPAGQLTGTVLAGNLSGNNVTNAPGFFFPPGGGGISAAQAQQIALAAANTNNQNTAPAFTNTGSLTVGGPITGNAGPLTNLNLGNSIFTNYTTFVVMGDSLSFSNSASQWQNMVGSKFPGGMTNFAVSGTTLEYATNIYLTVVRPLVQGLVTNGNVVISLWDGINNFGVSNQPAPQVELEYSNLCRYAQADGCYVYASHLTQASYLGTNSAGPIAFNAWLDANPQLYNWEGKPDLWITTNYNNKTYFVDTLHFTRIGGYILANDICNLLQLPPYANGVNSVRGGMAGLNLDTGDMGNQFSTPWSNSVNITAGGNMFAQFAGSNSSLTVLGPVNALGGLTASNLWVTTTNGAYRQFRGAQAVSLQTINLGAVVDVIGSYIASGSWYTNNNYYWPDFTNSAGIQFRNSGNIVFFANTNLTLGTPFIPTTVATLNPGGTLNLGGAIVATNQGTIVSSTISSGSAISMNTAVATNITSITLNAGTWIITGSVQFNPAGATSTLRSGGINTSVALPANNNRYQLNSTDGTTLESFAVPTQIVQIIGSPQTYYLIGYASFTGGPITCYGSISAVEIQ
jgi:hypothetical protein